MSKASNRPQRSISESDFAEISRRVRSLEEQWPLEVRVVASSKGGQYALGAIRMLALVFVVAEFLTWGLWVAVPSWAFHALILGLLFLGGAGLGRLPLARFFTSKGERAESVERRAHLAFAKAGVSQTTGRNGLLLYFSLPEKMFFLLPDTPLARLLPAEEWRGSVEGLGEALRSAPTGRALPAAVLHLLDDLEAKARKVLPARGAHDSSNELPDAIIFED